jgi:hypothetical protein
MSLFLVLPFDHRLFRVQAFLSGRPNWVPPPRHPQGSVAPPHFGSKGENTLVRGGGGGGGGTQVRRMDRHFAWYSMYTINPSTLLAFLQWIGRISQNGPNKKWNGRKNLRPNFGRFWNKRAERALLKCLPPLILSNSREVQEILLFSYFLYIFILFFFWTGRKVLQSLNYNKCAAVTDGSCMWTRVTRSSPPSPWVTSSEAPS